MDQYYGEWVPYSGNSAIILGAVLLVIAGVFALSGFKLKEPLRVKTPGKAMAGMLAAVWFLSILTFLVNAGIYSLLLNQAKLTGTIPDNPITIYTFSFALISFVIILVIHREKGEKLGLAFWSAAFAAMAGPMVFELPFDLIVISRTYPPIPPDPSVLRALFFFPLFMIELTTISLLFLSPIFKVTRLTLYSLAGMFLVFAIWGFLSFSFAYTAEFLVLNVVAKALAFVTVVTLFPPRDTLAAKSPVGSS